MRACGGCRTLCGVGRAALRPEAQADILDLCAAPGGKTLQLAACGAQVTALDASQSRLERLTANLARTGLARTTLLADLESWNPTRRFSRVLLDAPCSATGTIRRHPDLPLHRRRSDIEKSAPAGPPSGAGG